DVGDGCGGHRGRRMTQDEKMENREDATKYESSRRPYFGRRLRELRTNYLERISSAEFKNSNLITTPSANALVACLHRQGLILSAAAYNEIEGGQNVPRNAVQFLDAVAHCLSLNDDEKSDLARRLAYDILWARLRELTETVFPADPSWPDRDS